MGRRKKKKWIPWSQWTPVVQGLSKDSAESCSDVADLEGSTPMKPIEEESENISEDESCPSSIRNPESSDFAIDTLASEGNFDKLGMSSNLGIALQSDKLGFPEVPIGLQSDCSTSQMELQANPNSSIPSMDECDASNLGAHGCDSTPMLISISESISNPSDLREATDLKCTSMQKNQPNTGKSHYIWKPKNYNKQAKEQRAPVQKLKNHQTSNKDPGLDDSTEPCEQHQDVQCAASNQDIAVINSGILNDPSSRQPAVQPNLDVPHNDPSCSTSKAMDFTGNDKDGFKKVQTRRRKKSNEINPNPEHHQDKPGANASS
ncbi:hypothetical protein Dimus_037342 [Dionaea muscipula]